MHSKVQDVLLYKITISSQGEAQLKLQMQSNQMRGMCP